MILYDTDIKLYKGRDYILEEMEGLKFSINAKSFYQTNSDQAYELNNRDFAGLTGKKSCMIYTGTGTIAQFVSKKTKKSNGVESVPDAIKMLKQMRCAMNIDNCEFYVGGDMKVVTCNTDNLMLLSLIHQETECTKM
jgi:23S rRNA (uracil1939-C5)-methyltransferase